MRRIALPALVLALTAGGCGGGSGQTTTELSTQPASKQQFIQVGDAICANHQSRREDLESQARELGPLSTAAKARQVAALLRREAHNLRAEADELAARQLPPQDGSLAERVLESIRARARAIDRWAAAYEAGEEDAIRRGQIRVGVLAAKSQRRAGAYGFLVCGR